MLREAVTMDNLYLLKFGGNAIRGKDDLDRLSKEIYGLKKDGANIVLVHGGGPEITDEMEKRGLVAKKVAGQRITDDAGLNVAKDVLKWINDDVVDSLTKVGVDAKGIAGFEFIKAVKKAPLKVVENGKEIMVDLGKVGEVDKVDTAIIFDLLKAGKVPVIYPICAGPEGYLNVNADTVAAGVAAAIKSKEMIQITDVPGILMDVSDPKSKIDSLTLKDVDALIEKGIISGGMIPKVDACRSAIQAGVSKVRMVNGKDKTIVSDLLKNSSHGTVIKG